METSPPEKLKRTYGLLDLVHLNIVAIVGLRWLSIAAATGYGAMTLWALAFLAFFLPQAVVVLGLTRARPCEGGIYEWVNEALGEAHGFFCGFCYWMNNVVYYPSILIFLAGMGAHVVAADPKALGEDKAYVALFTLIVLWGAIGGSILGVRTGQRIQALGAYATWLPALAVVGLGGLAWWRFGAATPFSARALVAPLGDLRTVAVWSKMCFAFAGLELAALLGEEIVEPERTFPRALFIAGAGITFIYAAGTVALLVALPASQISEITGILQAISSAAQRFGLAWVPPGVALLIVVGGIGGACAWLGGTARIPFAAGLTRRMPAALGRIHPRYGTPHVALLFQGGLVTVALALALLGSTLREAYQILLDMTIVVYFIPYLYMFALYLGVGRLVAPSFAGRAAAVAGLVSTLAATGLALVPEESVTNVWLYEAKVVGGVAAFLVAALCIYRWGRARA